eukprot:1160469-Pelagomonas_calceolata.AAC.9
MVTPKPLDKAKTPGKLCSVHCTDALVGIQVSCSDSTLGDTATKIAEQDCDMAKDGNLFPACTHMRAHSLATKRRIKVPGDVSNDVKWSTTGNRRQNVAGTRTLSNFGPRGPSLLSSLPFPSLLSILLLCLAHLIQVVLKDIKVTSPSTIDADWVSAGWLKKELFPWQPKVPPFEGLHRAPCFACRPHAVYNRGQWPGGPAKANMEHQRTTSIARNFHTYLWTPGAVAMILNGHVAECVWIG